MDGLEAQYGGFFEKNAQKLASFEKYTYICNMKNLLVGDMIKTIRTEWR